MSSATPPTPTACAGMPIVDDDENQQVVEVRHCNGCAESASLRQRLATAEAERAEWQESAVGYAAALGNRQQAHEAALADAAALREQLEHERASHGETIKLMRSYRRQVMDAAPTMAHCIHGHDPNGCEFGPCAPTEPDGASGTKGTT